MPVQLVNSAAVVVAHDLNLSIFKPIWLQRQNILTDEELSGELVVSPAFVRIPAPEFELVVLPDRLQMRPRRVDEAQAHLVRVLGGIVSILPHTPFTATGLNFDYIVAPEGTSEFERWHSALFAAPYALRSAPRDQSGARFGAYFSFDALGMRLKIDIKPIPYSKPAGSVDSVAATDSERMLVKFNFHKDLGESPQAAVILNVLARWEAALSLARTIAEGAIANTREA